ncbi:MAG: arylsulfatase [Verrucomicrobiales bacterium]|nr:arylsulfatase [Verrucomicrobiales bacterium]
MKLLLTTLLLVTCHLSLAAGDRPNIIFVLFDDMAWTHPGSFPPESGLNTPSFDRLAAAGVRFTDAHSASAVCTPTRYGVLTGRYPSRIGQYGVCTTYTKPIIPDSRLTVASMLKSQGYTTACIGKWHLGLDWVDGKPGTQNNVPAGSRFTGGPNALGFDYFYGFTHARNIGTILEQDQAVDHVTAVENQPLMIDKAISWIDSQAKTEDPFFLYFPMCPPHTPVVPSPEYVGKSNASDRVKKDPKYADWVYQGDAMLGRIMDALNRNKLTGKTLVIATADNGAEKRPYPPLRDSKRSIYEGGHRVPFTASWPGHINPGTTNNTPVCLNDLFATAADITGFKTPDNAAEDSHTFLPLLKGETPKTPRPPIIHQSMKGDLAVRDGPWKLVFPKKGNPQLYNLESDLAETTDLATKKPDKTTRLTAAINSLIKNGRSTPGSPQKNDAPLTLP